MKFNRAVDSIFTNTVLAIEPRWGESCLKQYLHELDLIESGVPFSELGIKERKASQLPLYISEDDDEQIVTPLNTIENGAYAILSLSGVMRSQDGMSTRGIDSLINDFTRSYSDNKIIGVILKAETGGGEVTAAQKLRSAIASRNKPVLVHSNRLASGGILGTLDADEIIAYDEMSEFGSIGVYTALDKRFIQWYKDNIDEIYSDKSPDKNKAFRQYLAGDPSLIKEDVNILDDYFMRAVKESRELKGDISSTLAGGMFLAKDAKRRGLIDGIGNMTYVVERMKSHIASYKRKKK